jgi:hypothetical protein
LTASCDAAHSPPTACKHAVSGTISLPSQGFFSPFPHGTGSLSVEDEYLALPDGPGRFPQGFSCPAVLRSHSKAEVHFHVRGCHPLWPAFPDRSINALPSLFWSKRSALSSSAFRFRIARSRWLIALISGPTTPDSPCESSGLGFSAFARHYWRNHLLVFFSSGY